MSPRLILIIILCLASMAVTSPSMGHEPITPSISRQSGAINSVKITQGDRHLFLYRATEDVVDCDYLLITSHRRDAVHRAERSGKGMQIVGPELEKDWLTTPDQFWEKFIQSRFHDYSCQTTKILSKPIPIDRWLKQGDSIEWQGLKLDVIDTPGYSKGAISYVASIDGKKLAFTGDLIVGDGKILDLYSLQDAIPEAMIRGYHGYAGRLAQLIESLRKIEAAHPDLIVPARGPVITKPTEAIQRLIARVQEVYRNYLSTNALHWYFKEERMKQCGERILGKGSPIELMPYSVHEKAPDWVFEHSTSRLLLTENGEGFLIDCGYQRVIDAINKLKESGILKKVEGIFVTHYHDDHTDMVQTAAQQFDCPVYATEEYADILENPSAYHMPAMTSNPIQVHHRLKSGTAMNWHEFHFTFHFLPGQALYHGGLVARKGKERPIFFVGDSFAPSGIDDYCLLNRNLVDSHNGYARCFQLLRSIPEPFWIVNEHIPFVFQYTSDELRYLETRFQARVAALRELFPWDDPNYGIDEQWARFYPYCHVTQQEKTIDLSVHITNHSPKRRKFELELHLPDGMRSLQKAVPIELDPGIEGESRFRIAVGNLRGLHLVTADIRSEGMEFEQWIESMISIE